MKNFEENFVCFQDELHKVRECRVREYRENIYNEIEEFFSKMHEAVESMKMKKL